MLAETRKYRSTHIERGDMQRVALKEGRVPDDREEVVESIHVEEEVGGSGVYECGGYECVVYVSCWDVPE